MSVSKKKRRGFWRQSREALTVWGAASVAVFAFIVLIIITLVMHINDIKSHEVEPLTIQKIIKANTSGADKLMIVAHPDDETLWGGGHLMDGGYLVVSITGGRDKERSEEFIKAVKASGNTPLLLEYPDKVNFERDSWELVHEGIQHDIDLLVSYKRWSLIVCDNPSGEYGHDHHRMVSGLVTHSCTELGTMDRLWYFGSYYSKGRIGDYKQLLTPLDDERLDFKKYLLSFYHSQKETLEKFSQMVPYEMWVPAKEWN